MKAQQGSSFSILTVQEYFCFPITYVIIKSSIFYSNYKNIFPLWALSRYMAVYPWDCRNIWFLLSSGDCDKNFQRYSSFKVRSYSIDPSYERFTSSEIWRWSSSARFSWGEFRSHQPLLCMGFISVSLRVSKGSCHILIDLKQKTRWFLLPTLYIAI